RAKHPERGPRRRVSTLSDEPAYVAGLQSDQLHVGRACAHIFSGNISPAQPFYEAAVRAKEFLAIFKLAVVEDDRFAAAPGQTGDGTFVSHPAREPQSIDQRFLLAGVIPKARAANR